MASIVVSGDTSGTVTISAPAVAGTTTLTLPSTSGTVLTTASSTGISGSAISSGTVAEAYGGTGTNTGYYGFKNRIINGSMVISQRNGTTATSVSGNDIYTIDRYKGWANGGGVFSVTQSTTAPTGFANSALITVTTADSSIAAGDNYRFAQVIEGYNIADFGFGASGASTVTLSFWVRSSVTGTFGGSFYSSPATRSYVFNYTISSANTWTYITTTATGDTSGSWNNTNGQGLTIYFDLGSGSNYENATGSWVSAEKFRTSGNATLISTNGATWYVTGIQVEKGSTATSFDYRPYGTELQLCQRYYYKNFCTTGGSQSTPLTPMGYCYSGTSVYIPVIFPTVMRSTPTLDRTGGRLYNPFVGNAGALTGSTAIQDASNVSANIQAVVASGLTTGYSYWISPNTVATDYIAFSAEL